MKKFVHKKTKAILTPKSAFVTAQMEKSPHYEEYKEPVANPAPADEKPLSKMNKEELEKLAAEKGIEVPEGTKKEEIVKLLKEASEE